MAVRGIKSIINNRNLDNPVKLILKNLISLFDVLECESVGYERCGVNLTLSNKQEDFIRS